MAAIRPNVLGPDECQPGMILELDWSAPRERPSGRGFCAAPRGTLLRLARVARVDRYGEVRVHLGGLDSRGRQTGTYARATVVLDLTTVVRVVTPAPSPAPTPTQETTP